MASLPTFVVPQYASNGIQWLTSKEGRQEGRAMDSRHDGRNDHERSFPLGACLLTDLPLRILAELEVVPGNSQNLASHL